MVQAASAEEEVPTSLGDGCMYQISCFLFEWSFLLLLSSYVSVRRTKRANDSGLGRTSLLLETSGRGTRAQEAGPAVSGLAAKDAPREQYPWLTLRGARIGREGRSGEGGPRGFGWAEVAGC